MKAAGFFLLSVLLSGASSVAQSCSQEIAINLVDTETSRFLHGISSDQLQAKSRVGELRITGLHPIRTRRLLVLSDRSGSITVDRLPRASGLSPISDDLSPYTQTAMKIASAAIADFLAEQRPPMSVEYGAFTDVRVFSGPFVADNSSVRNSMELVDRQLPAKGHRSTALYDALSEAIRRFPDPQPEDAILMLTDGIENTSRINSRAIEKELRASHLRFFAILPASQPLLPEERAEKEQLIALSQRSGGSVFLLDPQTPGWGSTGHEKGPQEALYRFFSELLMNGYLLRVELPHGTSKEIPWRVTLQGNSKAAVLAPERLPACVLQEGSR